MVGFIMVGHMTLSPLARADGTGTPPFAKGADVSWVTQMEADGYSWCARDGTPKDLFQILTNLGLNSIRLRVWVNPVNGWNNQADTVAKAMRARNAGLRVMIDFHYSDTWADPGHQPTPAAWTNFTTAQLISAVYDHTYNVMSGLKSAGVDAEWVQVGNEISCGLLWPNGYTCGPTNNLTNVVAMINSGYAAVKAVSPSTRVIIHLNNGQNNYRWWFDPAVNLGVHFDVIGLSLYPTTNTNWMSDTAAAFANMSDIAARYGKEVMIAETGMDATVAQACQNMLADLMNKTRSVPSNRGIGLFYWEPEAYAYWGQSAWLSNGRPTIAMDAFAFTPNQPPGSPALSATNGPAKVQLNWTVPVGATSYKVKRSVVSGGPYTVITSLTATNFADTNVLSETPYYYVVSAANAFGEGANASEVVGFNTTNAVALYAFEGEVRDTSGDGKHGINYGVTFTTGKIGAQAAQFNGSNAWVQIPASIGSSSLSIALWVKTTDSGSSGQWYAGEGLVDGEVSGVMNDFGLTLLNGKIAFGIGNPDTTLQSTVTVNDGQWHQVIATRNGFDGRMALYLDGNLNTNTVGPIGARVAPPFLRLGSLQTGAAGKFYNGVLEEVRLYNGWLDTNSLAQLLVQPAALAQLKFDEATGTSAADATGHGWAGTLRNGPTWVAGHTGNAVSLNSSGSNYVSLPNGVVSNLSGFSITAWVKLNTNGAWARVFDFGTGMTNYMFLSPVGSGNTLRFAITTTAGAGEQQINYNTTLTTGVWHHVAVTLGAGCGILYLDGVAVGTNNAITLTPADLGNTTQNWIGRSQYSDPYLNAAVDDFRIYNGTLSASDVASFVTPLAAPTGLAATRGDAQAALTWNAAPVANGYNLRRATTSSGPYSLVGTNLPTLNFTDLGLTNGTRYYYVANATNAVTESANSIQVSALPVSAAPTELSVLFNANQLQLTWPGDHTGWLLQAQTNSLTSGLGSGWFPVLNSDLTNQLALPCDPSSPSIFFRLVSPY